MIHTTFNNNYISIDTINTFVEHLVIEKDENKPLSKYLSADFNDFENVNLLGLYGLQFNEGDTVKVVCVEEKGEKNIVAIEFENSIYYLLENQIKKRKNYWAFLFALLIIFIIPLLILSEVYNLDTGTLLSIFFSVVLIYIPLSFTLSDFTKTKNKTELKSLIHLELAKSSKN